MKFRLCILAALLAAPLLRAQTYQMTGTAPTPTTLVQDGHLPPVLGYNFVGLAVPYYGLCRWNTQGNTQTHNVYLFDGTLNAVVQSVAIDTAKGIPGGWQCVQASGTLVAGHAYAVDSSESPVDQITTFASYLFDPTVGIDVEQNYFMTDPPTGIVGYGNTANQSLGPVNLEMTAPAVVSTCSPLSPGTPHTLTLGGIVQVAGSTSNTTFFVLTDFPPSLRQNAGTATANSWTGDSMDVTLDGVSMICAYTATSYSAASFTWNCAVPLTPAAN